MTISTRARFARARVGDPAKMTSDIEPPRTFFAECVPSTYAMASTTFDLPDPLGPTITVIPGSTSSTVRSANDLNPRIERDVRNTRTPARTGTHGGRRGRGNG